MNNKSLEKEGSGCNFSMLLELAASDDLVGFGTAVELEGYDVNETGLWYGRRIGSKRMGLEERTPLMIAAMFGSTNVLNYILKKGHVDVNRICGSDGATPLHSAIAGGATSAVNVVKSLLDASAGHISVDCKGRRPADLIAPTYYSVFNSRGKKLEEMLERHKGFNLACTKATQTGETESLDKSENSAAEKKEYPFDPSLPDIKNGIYRTDEFRMYVFKIQPCSRAYTHDWTECPFVHPGENARRRDPRVYQYSCVPCPEFRKGSCDKGDNCEYSHGIFECWLHPSQYRTRLCKDGTGCPRKVCFFAHKPEELRPLYASTGSAIPSPKSYTAGASLDRGSMSPIGLTSPSVRTPPTSTPSRTPSMDMGSISPIGLASPSVRTPPTSTPPLTPGSSSIRVGPVWQSQSNAVPTLQLPIGRFRRRPSSQSINSDMDSIGIESNSNQQNLLREEISDLLDRWKTSMSASATFASSPSDRNAEFNRLGIVNQTNLDNTFVYPSPEISPRLQSLSPNTTVPQLQSPSGIHMNQSMNQQLLSSYRNCLLTSPGRSSPSFAISSSRVSDPAGFGSPSFNNPSLSFFEQSLTNSPGLPSPNSSATPMRSSLSGWNSPNGKLDWSVHAEDRPRKSFNFQSSGSIYAETSSPEPGNFDGLDVSWVQSLVKDGPHEKEGQRQYHINNVVSDSLPARLGQEQAAT